MQGDRLKEALDWLYSTQFFGIKLGLENSEKLLSTFLAYPNHNVQVIQVAGTNGKGSTCAFLDSVARAHGIRTGLFTSPHLVRFSERIRVSGEEIPEAHLVSLIENLRGLVAQWDPHPTFFELSLALAMRYFKEAECELIILETGMGGRLDATSAVPKDVAVITPIGLDHQQYLGETLVEIAGEKAAIMREGKPCVSAQQVPEVQRVLEVTANERRCALSFIKEPLRGYDLGLAGAIQKENAALALEGLYQLQRPLNYTSVAEGLKAVRWPGRFQCLEHEGGETVLDCCHNVPAAEELKKIWKETYGDRKGHLLFGAVKDKDIRGVLEVLLPLAESVEVYTLNNPRAEQAEVLMHYVKELSPELPCAVIEDIAEGKTGPLRLITGSLFLIGEWLSL